MKFFLDMPISQRTAGWLKSSGFEVVHAREVGLARAEDTNILRRAADEGRILLTMDLDFPRILALTGARRPGVILFRMRDPRPPLIQKRLEFLFQTHAEAELASSITIIEDYRIRIRKLPIF